MSKYYRILCHLSLLLCWLKQVSLHLIYDFKTYQHGIVLLDGAEAVE